MSAYRGHLTTVVGDGPEVVIKLSGQDVRVLTPDGRVHTWPSQDVRVTGISGSRFWLAFDGEIAVFAPEEPEAFMLEFLPGLKAARTVAEALAAAAGSEDLGQPAPTEEAEHAPGPLQDTVEDQTRQHVVAYKPRLPQLADHVEASRNGSIADLVETQRAAHETEVETEPEPEPETPDRRRWWSRGQTPPPLRPKQPEDISVDITDDALDASDDDRIGAEANGDESGEENSLLRALANRHQAYESGRRGTYKPRR